MGQVSRCLTGKGKEGREKITPYFRPSHPQHCRERREASRLNPSGRFAGLDAPTLLPAFLYRGRRTEMPPAGASKQRYAFLSDNEKTGHDMRLSPNNNAFIGDNANLPNFRPLPTQSTRMGSKRQSCTLFQHCVSDREGRTGKVHVPCVLPSGVRGLFASAQRQTASHKRVCCAYAGR